MAIIKNKDGTTTRTGADSLANLDNPDRSKYDIVPNEQGGYQADKKNPWLTYGIPAAVGSIFAAGPFLQGGGAVASATGGIQPGMIANSAPNLGAAVAPTAATGVPAFTSMLHQLISTPQGLASLVALIPALKAMSSGSGGSNPFGGNSDLMGQINDGMAMQNARTKQAQPVYDALINQAYGRTPTRYRGAAPAGYPAGGDAPPDGAYKFSAPQFGGR